MPNEFTLNRLHRTAYRHTLQDGLAEVAMGLFLVLYGLLFNTPTIAVFPLLIVLFVLVPGVRMLQKRFTHPRIGCVEPVSEKGVHLVFGMLVYTLAVFAVLVLQLILTGEFTAAVFYRWIPALAGVLVAGGMHYASARSGLARFRFYLVVSIAGGIALSLVALPGRLEGLRAYLFGMGMLVVIGGVITFARFLKCNPVVTEEGSDAC